jgi:hypothetical protein
MAKRRVLIEAARHDTCITRVCWQEICPEKAVTLL